MEDAYSITFATHRASILFLCRCVDSRTGGLKMAKQPKRALLQASKVRRQLTRGVLEIPVIRRSRESGNPEKSRCWIPAYAGMTGFSSFPRKISNGKNLSKKIRF
jgi:hypothetical protein